MTKWIGATLALLLFAGCATKPQAPLVLTADVAASKSGRIGIAMSPMPKVDTNFPGASCLLCMAAASVANNSLTSLVQTLTPEDLATLKTQLADALRKKGSDVVVIPDAIKLDSLPDAPTKGGNLATKDFSSLKAKYKIDKLLLIDVKAIGVERTYSAYVPTSDPKGMVRANGFLVNLSSNAYEWYLPVAILKSADGAWDEPPKFPGVTNAYFQAIEIGKDNFMRPFVQ